MYKTIIFVLTLVLFSTVLGIYLYPTMPERMASHWNASGEVDGYISKFWGLFLMPLVMLGLLVLFIVIPKIDPLKHNIKQFQNYDERFIVAISIFFFYIYLLTLAWSFGARFDMGFMIMPALAGLFYCLGIMTEHTKRNWFIGMRTPWTLMSDTVWEKTHQRGGKLFKISGVLALFGMAFPDYALWFVLLPAIATSLYTIVYSYFLYQKEGSSDLRR